MAGDSAARRLRHAGGVRGLCVLVTAGLMTVGGSAQHEPGEMRDFFRSRWTYQPAWSPDGSRILYVQDDWSSQDLFVVDLNGGAARKLSRSVRFLGNPRGNSAGQPPVWSPDGSEILVRPGRRPEDRQRRER